MIRDRVRVAGCHTPGGGVRLAGKRRYRKSAGTQAERDRLTEVAAPDDEDAASGARFHPSIAASGAVRARLIRSRFALVPSPARGNVPRVPPASPSLPPTALLPLAAGFAEPEVVAPVAAPDAFTTHAPAPAAGSRAHHPAAQRAEAGSPALDVHLAPAGDDPEVTPLQDVRLPGRHHPARGGQRASREE